MSTTSQSGSVAKRKIVGVARGGQRQEVRIPLGMLDISEQNARTSEDGDIEALAASIKAQGQLQNIVVHLGEDGRYKVAGGGRRLRAFKQLQDSGFWTADQEIRALLVEASEARAASVAENMHEPMHAADEYDAFKKLVDENWTIDRIADAFGVSALVVERRLRLSAAAPELIEEFRAGELSTDQLIGLCASDDHERQLRAWKQAKDRHWMTSPKDLRKAVLADAEIDVSNDPRIGFIGGLDVYRAAGGGVRRDLFMGDGSGGFITDAALLDSLVADKLDEHAASVRAEGWAWVDVWPAFDHVAFNRLGRAPQSLGAMPKKAAAQLASLRASLDAAEAELHTLHEGNQEEYTEEQSARLDELYELAEDTLPEQIEAVEKAHRTWDAEVKAAAGAVVMLSDGALRIERGLVRTADRKAVQAATGDEREVEGGRETETAGKKPDAVSDALRRSLLGHRNLAAQGEVAKRPDVAKVLLACWTVEHIRSHVGGGYRGGKLPTDFGISGGQWLDGGRGQKITDEDGQAKERAFGDACAALTTHLPDDAGKLWDALAGMTGEEIDRIIAHGVALSVSLSNEHKGVTAKLLDMLGFDAAAHFTPTAANYLGRVSKALMLEALDEAGKVNGAADKTALQALKKGALATEAEARLAGSGWVPKGIRTPKPKAAPKKANAKPKSKKG